MSITWKHVRNANRSSGLRLSESQTLGVGTQQSYVLTSPIDDSDAH